jgi:hypothetical protein
VTSGEDFATLGEVLRSRIEVVTGEMVVAPKAIVAS